MSDSREGRFAPGGGAERLVLAYARTYTSQDPGSSTSILKTCSVVVMTVYVPVNHGTVIHSISLLGDPEPMAVTFGIFAVTASDPLIDVAVPALTAELHDAFGDIVMPFLSTEATLTQTEVAFVNPSSNIPVLGVDSTPRVGGTSGAMLPQNSALLVHKRSAAPGRIGRGRLYLPSCLREAQVDNKGIIAALEVSGLQTPISSWLTRVANNTAPAGVDKDMVILHTVTPANPALTPTVVTSLVVDSLIATQRRRLRK